LFFTVLRSGKDLILPLKGENEGLPKGTVGTIVSACNAAESISFPLAGILMDRYGRKFSGIPASLILALGFLGVPFVREGWTLFAAAVVLGLGNGLSSGIVMTIGTDLAPKRHRGEFLGLFLILEDGGRLIAPLLLGALSAGINLDAAGYAFAITGVFCAAWMWLACKETLHKETEK
jgi:MFS family permease